MLLHFLLVLGGAAPCDRPSAPALQVVCAYFAALQLLDHEGMDSFWAAEVVTESPTGEVGLLDRNFMRSVRGFERGTETRWSFRIDGVSGDSVLATLTEANALYDALGVGDRTQQQLYLVRADRIAKIHTLSVVHATGDYPSAYQAFKQWLLSTDAARDTALTGQTTLRFTSQSAERMKPWLKRWRERSVTPR